MGKDWKKNILQAIVGGLLVALIIGLFAFNRDYGVDKALQQEINIQNKEYHKKNDIQFKKIIESIDGYSKKVDEHHINLDTRMDDLDKKIKILTYVVSKNDSAIAKTLKEMKESGVFTITPQYNPTYQPQHTDKVKKNNNDSYLTMELY